MLEDFDKVAREMWEKSKPPLEKMYDRWMGEGNWEPERPRTRYAIYSWKDTQWQGLQVMAGQRFPCHLCGETDRWTIVGDEVKREIRVFICEHEPIPVGRGAVRQISSVPARLVSRFEETYRFLD
jgi:hypothetical protein